MWQAHFLKKFERKSGLNEGCLTQHGGPFEIDYSNTRGFDLAVLSVNNRQVGLTGELHQVNYTQKTPCTLKNMKTFRNLIKHL